MYDSGTIKICNLINQSENGLMPKQKLCVQNKFWFEMRTIGINRSYLAKGVNERVDLLVRIPRYDNVEIGQYAVLGNGDQYRITLVTHGHNESHYARIDKGDFHKGYKTAYIVDLDYTELTLMKIEDNYEVEYVRKDCEN